jgi:hypothetical protein
VKTCGAGCCGCSKNGILFKLSLMGFLFSVLLMAAGSVYPYRMITVQFPKAWILGLFTLIVSMVVYYNVRDAFWDEVIAAHKASKKPLK